MPSFQETITDNTGQHVLSMLSRVLHDINSQHRKTHAYFERQCITNAWVYPFVRSLSVDICWHYNEIDPFCCEIISFGQFSIF